MGGPFNFPLQVVLNKKNWRGVVVGTTNSDTLGELVIFS